MTYDVEINRRKVTYWSESGEWLEGDSVELSSEPTDVESYPVSDDPWDTPHGWAVELIRGTDVSEPSSYPVGDAAAPHEWLHGYYTDPYTGHETETTIRLTGDWTEQQRAHVFTDALNLN